MMRSINTNFLHAAENKDSMAMKTGKRGTNAKLFSEQVRNDFVIAKDMQQDI